MDGEEFAFYNTIVYFERNKHNRSPESPCRWPGKRLNAKAFSKYPNIVAFMRYSVSPYIITAAEIASVSPEKMTAVGVTWLKNRRKWQASIRVNGEMIYLGKYKSLTDAVAAREAAEIQYFGEYRRK